MSMKDDIKYVEKLGFQRTESMCIGDFAVYSRWFNGGFARLTAAEGKWRGKLQALDFSKDYGPVEESKSSFCPAPGVIVGKMLADLDGLSTAVASIKAGLRESFFTEAISRSGE